ncbi:hypothetical protein Y032_0057g2740 [Ancylostoma ceylanicum]|uniref:Uncharacterized protein n=1 Tax=Ancylostoma ceylanicum TaxID=53326 RepID=A0A016U465_9BILA|nr:hypothetical protein Y032_0057g2740 [Ancylostoma ceylanicum]
MRRLFRDSLVVKQFEYDLIRAFVDVLEDIFEGDDGTAASNIDVTLVSHKKIGIVRDHALVGSDGDPLFTNSSPSTIISSTIQWMRVMCEFGAFPKIFWTSFITMEFIASTTR